MCSRTACSPLEYVAMQKVAQKLNSSTIREGIYCNLYEACTLVMDVPEVWKTSIQ